jgi:hypothetical protein
MGEHRKDLTRYNIGDMLVNINEEDEYYGDLLIILDIENDSRYPYYFYSFVMNDKDHCHEDMFKDYKKVENVEELPYNP